MNIWLAEIWRAWRASLRRPGFLLLAAGVLALGVGSTAAVSTLIGQVLLKPLPVPQASRLLVAGFWGQGHVNAVSPQQYQHMQSLSGVQSIGLIQDGPKLNIAADMRLNLLLVGIFAALALLLAAAGMYAVMAVAVAAREREFGVRSALGAEPSRLVRLVLRGGLLQIASGLLLGVGLALALSGVLRAVLEDIGRSTVDPVALAGVCVLLAIAGLLACLLPALRAGRVHPIRALRGEQS